MNKLQLPFSEVTSRVFGYWAYDQGLSITNVILPGFINSSSPEKLKRMNFVAETAASLIMATISPNELTLPADQSLNISDQSLANAFNIRLVQARQAGSIGIQSAVELLSMNYHLDKGGFEYGSEQTGMIELYRRIEAAFPTYN